jgi:flagellar biosynthetic protein FlhB
MAENDEDRDTDDLSEEASPYRLEEFRRKGQVSQSKELVALFVAVACGVAVFAMAPGFAEEIIKFMKDTFSNGLIAKPGDDMQKIAGDRLLDMLIVVAKIGLPISLIGMVLGIASHLAQIGFIFSTEAITPDLDKINPLNGLKRLFSMRNLTETARVLVKGIVVLYVAYVMVKSDILESPALIFQNPKAILDVLGKSGKSLFLSLMGVLAVFAAIDFVLQRREFGKQVRVTRKEAKQEAKEQEGDPMVKSRIRSIQRDMARKRMMKEVKSADVIITNPTHIAIALRYDKDKMVAPKVVAKGADFMAENIKKLAREAGIPLVENVPLARAMFKSVKVGHVIPRNLFQAVAEVLAYVYKLKNKSI